MSVAEADAYLLCTVAQGCHRARPSRLTLTLLGYRPNAQHQPTPTLVLTLTLNLRWTLAYP